MRSRPLFLALLLGLLSAGAASAQVRIQIGGPVYGRPYYAPRPYGYYPPVAAPVIIAPPPPVYYAPAPVYYAPRPRYYAPAPIYYGQGYGRGYGRGHGRRW